MKIVKSIDNPAVVDCLVAGGVVVLKTDTLYGLLAQADNQSAVERVYRLKSRDEAKSPVVLIANESQTYDPITENFRRHFGIVWPDRTTVVLPSRLAPVWIRRNNQSVAYRVPAINDLQKILNITGRLIAPSANPQGELPAESIERAIEYFGDGVDVYVDSGPAVDNQASQIIKLHTDGHKEQLR